MNEYYLYMGDMDLKTGRSVSERLNAPLVVPEDYKAV